MSTNDKTSNLLRLTGLWRNKNGTGYSGSLGAARLVLLQNDRKRDGSNDPDLVLFLAPSEKREGGESEGERRGGGQHRTVRAGHEPDLWK